MEKVNKSYAIMKPQDWLGVLNTALATVDEMDAPPDVGIAGQFHELLEEFLTNRAAGRVKEDLLSGRPWEDEEEKRHYFRLSDIQRFLVNANMKDLKRSQITTRIKELKGGDHGFNIKGRFVSCWWVPSDAVRRMESLDPPKVKPSPI